MIHISKISKKRGSPLLSTCLMEVEKKFGYVILEFKKKAQRLVTCTKLQ